MVLSFGNRPEGRGRSSCCCFFFPGGIVATRLAVLESQAVHGTFFELDFDFIREQLDVLLPLPPPSPVSLEAETCLGKATRGVSDGDCHFFFFIMED